MNESNGYTKAPHDIVRNPDLSPAAKVAWLLIAGMPEGYHPTREQWMAMLPCRDKSTWQKVVTELENAGLVEVEKHGTKPVFKAVLKGGKNHPPKGEKIHPQRVEKTTLKGWKKPPYMKNIIEEQLKTIVDDAGAHAREGFIQEINQDYAVEQACMSLGIDAETYATLSKQVIAEWQFRDLPESEWTRMHFLSVMRYKVKEQRNAVHQQRKTRQQPGQISGEPQGKNPLAGFPTYTKTGS